MSSPPPEGRTTSSAKTGTAPSSSASTTTESAPSASTTTEPAPFASTEEEPVTDTDWPLAPDINAACAVLMEAGSGTILYDKNMHQRMYPASTTKILTCLLAVENSSLNETVSFSYQAVHSVPADGSSIGMDAGESLPMEQCIYGILVGSANEAANAVAEHVAGDIPSFVKKMNEKAKELGCRDSHFMNPNGLHNKDHYTSCYDLATIGRAFFSNDFLCRASNIPRYHFTPSAHQPDDFYLNNKNQLVTGQVKCEGIVGGKTGYTSQAGETLVSCAERNGMKLICVVMKDDSPDQFLDSAKLFEYGFRNFTKTDLNENQTSILPDQAPFLSSDYAVFPRSPYTLRVSDHSCVILPNGANFLDVSTRTTKTEVTGKKNGTDGEREIAGLQFFWHDRQVGSADVLLTPLRNVSSVPANRTHRIYINLYLLFLILLLLAILLSFALRPLFAIQNEGVLQNKKNRRHFKHLKKETRKLHF